MPRSIDIPKDQVSANEETGVFTWTVPDNAGIVMADELAEHYVAQDVHDRSLAGVEKRISGAVANAETKFEAAAIADDEFLARAIAGRKEFFGERFPKSGEGPDPETLLAAFRTEHVEPLEEIAKGLRGENAGLKRKAVLGAINGVLVEHPPTEEHASLVRDHLLRRTEWSDEIGDVVVVNPDLEHDDPNRLLMVLDGAQTVPQTLSGYITAQRESGKLDGVFASKIVDGGDLDVGGKKGSRETLQQQIARLEGEGKFAEAAPLKEAMVQRAIPQTQQ